MKIEIFPVRRDEKEILRNLFEKYDYEFSQYDNRDVNALGLYGYDWLDCYWTQEHRWVFFIKVDGHLAGFTMVNDVADVKEKTDYTMAEFFVLYKYRRNGVGKTAAFTMFDRFKGRWQLKRHPKNTGSIHFWNNIISEYTKGNFRLIESYPGAVYDDGTLGDVFLFDT